MEEMTARTQFSARAIERHYELANFKLRDFEKEGPPLRESKIFNDYMDNHNDVTKPV